MVTVADDATGAVLAAIRVRAELGLTSVMQLAANAGGAQDADSRGMKGALEPVAGRIDAAPSDLAEATEAWLADLRARRRSAATVSQYASEVRRAAREMGWASAADVTQASVAEYMSGKKWSGASYNRARCCFKSLAAFLVRSGRLERDPMTGAPRAAEDGG